MTVKELMKELEKLPQDTEILTTCDEETFHIIRKVQFVKWNDNIKFFILNTKRDIILKKKE